MSGKSEDILKNIEFLKNHYYTMDENKIFSVYTPEDVLMYQNPTLIWQGEFPNDHEIKKYHIQALVNECMPPFMYDFFMKYMKPQNI